MVCENCGSEHDGNYGSGRFCCEKCARCFSTKAKRVEINEKVSKTLCKIDKINNVHSYVPKESYCLCCGNRTKLNAKKFCSFRCQHEYNYLIFINKWILGLEKGRKGRLETSCHIRRYFFKKYNNSCQKCGWAEINNYTGNVPLELHHVDGNYKNNKEENLELLCPNCHSLTDTYKSLNKNNTRIYTQKR